MRRRPITPVGAVVRGAAAGAVGTAAMDILLFARYRRDGGESRFPDWELSAGLDRWEDVPAPGQVGKRLAEGFLQRVIPPRWARFTNNLVHWGYGVAWGAQYGIVAASLAHRRARHGVLFGSLVGASGYVVLPLAELYKPMWEYDAKTLGKDLSAHVVYGVATATAFRVLAGR
jgi:hypothetical protein